MVNDARWTSRTREGVLHKLWFAVSYYTQATLVLRTERLMILFASSDTVMRLTLLVLLSTQLRNRLLLPLVEYHNIWKLDQPMEPYQVLQNSILIVYALQALESVQRLKYCMVLSYRHHIKLVNTELCCSWCESPLHKAAHIKELYVYNTVGSVVCLVYLGTMLSSGAQIVLTRYKQLLKSSLVTNDSFAGRTAAAFLQQMQDCCLANCNQSVADQVQLLVEVGASLSDIISDSCAIKKISCSCFGVYGDMLTNTIMASVNYTLLWCALAYMKKLHKFETQSLRRRMGVRDDNFITVLRVRHSRAQLRRDKEQMHSQQSPWSHFRGHLMQLLESICLYCCCCCRWCGEDENEDKMLEMKEKLQHAKEFKMYLSHERRRHALKRRRLVEHRPYDSERVGSLNAFPFDTDDYTNSSCSSCSSCSCDYSSDSSSCSCCPA